MSSRFFRPEVNREAPTEISEALPEGEHAQNPNITPNPQDESGISLTGLRKTIAEGLSGKAEAIKENIDYRSDIESVANQKISAKTELIPISTRKQERQSLKASRRANKRAEAGRQKHLINRGVRGYQGKNQYATLSADDHVETTIDRNLPPGEVRVARKTRRHINVQERKFKRAESKSSRVVNRMDIPSRLAYSRANMYEKLSRLIDPEDKTGARYKKFIARKSPVKIRKKNRTPRQS